MTTKSKIGVLAVAMVGALLAFSPASRAQSENDVAAAIRAKLHKSQFKDVQVNVDANGVATLSGTVDLYENKEDADRTTHKVKGVTAVRNDIEVGGPNLSDADIEKKLGPKLAYSREGYYDNLFDAIALQVHNGVVTLGGHAADYPSRDAAVAIASTTPGVKDVVDEIQVDPPSPMDNQIRMQVARAIYGYPALDKYAVDPVRPIRISVQNGNVELYGMVDSAQDRNMAFLRAKTVPNVFDVKNYIQVANQPSEKQQGANPPQH